MKICIIGDSWGGSINNYIGVFENLFAKHKHSVLNISAGGASNRGQLQMLEYQVLNKNSDFDLIIWIYTEPVRNYTEFVTLEYGDDESAVTTVYSELTYHDLRQDLEILAQKDFEHAQRLFNVHHIPFFVIGGAGRVTDSIDNYSFASWVKKSWNQEISCWKKIPTNCYTHHLVRMVRHGNYDKKQSLEELDFTDRLEKFMYSNKKQYPDGRHPNIEYYPGLVDQIIKQIQEKNLL